jgi:hypothetical protein
LSTDSARRRVLTDEGAKFSSKGRIADVEMQRLSYWRDY